MEADIKSISKLYEATTKRQKLVLDNEIESEDEKEEECS